MRTLMIKVMTNMIDKLIKKMKSKRSSSTFIYFISLTLSTFTVSVNGASLTWQTNLPDLPAPAGELIQHGVAGAYSGVLTTRNETGAQSEVLIVAGGANFSKTPLVDAIKADVAPEKIYHQDIFLLSNNESNAKQWQQTKMNLPLGAAYGESFTTEQGILLFGGEVKQMDGSVENTSDIALIYYQQGKLRYKKIGKMPVTFAKGGSAYYQGKVYIVGGIQNGKASNNVYSYDIETATWRKEQALTGKSRVSPVVTIHVEENQKKIQLYVFSGFSTDNNENIALDDGLSLDISTESAKWQTIAPIKALFDKQLSLIGAATIKVGEQQTLFLGGYNKKTWDDWLKTYQNVKGTKQEKNTKVNFFSQQPLHFSWNKDALLFDSSNQTWTNLGETPFLPNCGAAIEYWQNSIVLINGEIMPGVRTASVKMATFEDKKQTTINKQGR
mgnify:CR=1 FL=1